MLKKKLPPFNKCIFEIFICYTLAFAILERNVVIHG